MSTNDDAFRELEEALRQLPERTANRVAKQWTKEWSARAYLGALRLAPRGTEGNIIKGLARRDTSPAALRKVRAMARSVVIGKKPAYHFHLVVQGTGPRYTKGKGFFGKPAFRGRMPANPFMDRAAAPLEAPAIADLRMRVQKSLARLLKKGGA